MNKLLFAATCCLLVLYACERKSAPSQKNTVTTPYTDSIEVYFSPGGGATTALVEALDAASSSVLVQAYSFTSAPIAGALKRANDRGLDVKVILDKSQRLDKYSSATFLQHANIPLWVDARHAIAHNKVMVIDGSIVVTGSFNFTKAAEERNAENLLIMHSPQLAKQYTENGEIHAGHSEMFR